MAIKVIRHKVIGVKVRLSRYDLWLDNMEAQELHEALAGTGCHCACYQAGRDDERDFGEPDTSYAEGAREARG